LPDKPEESATAGIRALWFASAGQHRSVQKAAAGDLPALSEAEQKHLNYLIDQRLSGVPLAHLIGFQNFMGLELKAGPQALIPRKETEILGYAALDRLRHVVRSKGHARVMDVCTGSGNLAVALASHEPACRIVASDLCEDAVVLARENSALHQLQDRIEFRIGDLFAPFAHGDFDGAMDLVVCNPPYLSSSKVNMLPREIGEFEPREAFDAGSFGLGIISRLISESPRFLKPSSWLCFEVGLGQGAFFLSRLKQVNAFRTVETAVDGAGETRVLIAGT
jgi:release factor glutamine methyltransferase